MLSYFYWVVTLLKRMIVQFKPCNTTKSRFKSQNQSTKRFFIEFFTEFVVFMLFFIILLSWVEILVWMSTSRKIYNDFFSHGGEKVEMFGNYVCSTALFHYHFLKVQQAAYLKEAKAILDNETCIILMDFLENYSFLVQDAIQSFFWQNQQATLHPSAVCHNDDNSKLKCDCYCVILDHLLHDQTADQFYFISNTNNLHKKPQNQQD